MRKELLREIIASQMEFFMEERNNLFPRGGNFSPFLQSDEIVVITGIRRCGKSSLLQLFSKEIKTPFIFLHFDDIRLINFTVENCTDTEDIAQQMYPHHKKITFFLDEIQNIPHWEQWVNSLHMKGHKVFITGSNSNLLSSEFSTFLTGRHQEIHLFPFSYQEFLQYNSIKIPKNMEFISASVRNMLFSQYQHYKQLGGFPQSVKQNDNTITRQYFTDSIEKDIFNRYAIREKKELKDLALFLITNAGNKASLSKLKSLTSVNSIGSIKNFLEYLQETFLFFGVSVFDYSLKRQILNPQKIYSIDTGMMQSVGFSFSQNSGMILEHLVFLHLKRQGKSIFYHSGKKECDFVIQEKLHLTEAFQVCVSLQDADTRKRELDGLLDAINSYNLQTGFIITEEEEEEIFLDNKKISVLPFWKWALLSNFD